MKNCILRGKLLKLLSEQYPDGLERVTLISIYYQFDKVEDIEKSLAYLCDKGFIQKKEHPNIYNETKKIIYYKITPEGIDLVEGTSKQEPGIVIPQEV